MSLSELRKLIVSGMLAICLAGLSGTAGLAQKSKLGTAGVAIQTSDQSGGGTLVVIRRNGREFAKYSAPAGTRDLHLCCFLGKCSPLRPGNDICDIVIYCPFPECSPQ